VSFLLLPVSPPAILNLSLIFISIASMDSLQILRMRIEAVQDERWPLTYRHPTNISTGILASRNLGLHDVAGLKSHESFALCSMTDRKAIFVRRTLLSCSSPGGFDPKRLHIRDLDFLRRAPAHARSIDPMRFRQASLRTIEFRQSAEPVSTGRPTPTNQPL
jgi:hypothetical protein